MPKNTISDFTRGYEYAQKIYGRLADGCDVGEILELAEALSGVCGDNAELALGMAAYCRELAQRREK